MPRVSVTSLVFSLGLLSARAIFLIRPFIKEAIQIDTPRHNFWPYVPVTLPHTGENETHFFQRPNHNFWPFVPVRSPVDGNATWRYFDVPRHNFWPFVPIVPPGNRTKPLPPTAPPPTLPPPESSYDYGEVLYKSILFYEAQRSGWLPDDRKVTWRGHSALEDMGEYGEDLSGGWYDAGDYVKFGLPMAGAASMLLLGLVEFEDAYRAVNLLDDMYDCVRWPLDYFIKAHPSKYEFYAMVADPYVDHSYWGRPEDMTMYRPSYKLTPEAPGSDVIGETAAAMAAGSIAFKDVDRDYSELLLRHAKEMFDFADRYRGLYSDSLPIVQEFYSSSGYNDELAWAAAWLYRATGDNRYLQKAEENYESRECWAVSWDAKDCLAALLLFQLTKGDRYRYDIQRTMKAWMPGGTVDYTPGGLAFRTPWGPLRYTANMATLALVAANAGIEPVAYRQWARSQIHYMLGDAGRSFVVGFGYNPPTRPHHAASSCPYAPTPCTWAAYTTPDPNPITLYGALVGGPSGDDSFHDYRGDYYQNEVTCDYNSGFQSAIAGLIQLEVRQKVLEKLGELTRRTGVDTPTKNFKGEITGSRENPDKRRPFRQPDWRRTWAFPGQRHQQSNSGFPNQRHQQSNSGFPNQRHQQSNSGFPNQRHQQINSGFPNQRHQQINSGFPNQRHQQINSGFPNQRHQQINSGFPNQRHQQINSGFPSQRHQQINSGFPSQRHQQINSGFPSQRHQQINSGFPNQRHQQINSGLQLGTNYQNQRDRLVPPRMEDDQRGLTFPPYSGHQSKVGAPYQHLVTPYLQDDARQDNQHLVKPRLQQDDARQDNQHLVKPHLQQDDARQDNQHLVTPHLQQDDARQDHEWMAPQGVASNNTMNTRSWWHERNVQDALRRKSIITRGRFERSVFVTSWPSDHPPPRQFVMTTGKRQLAPHSSTQSAKPASRSIYPPASSYHQTAPHSHTHGAKYSGEQNSPTTGLVTRPAGIHGNRQDSAPPHQEWTRYSESLPGQDGHGVDSSPGQDRHGVDSSPGQDRHGVDSSPGQDRHGVDFNPGQDRHGVDFNPGQDRHGVDSNPGQDRHGVDGSSRVS